jgi:hypothetical protein
MSGAQNAYDALIVFMAAACLNVVPDCASQQLSTCCYNVI